MRAKGAKTAECPRRRKHERPRNGSGPKKPIAAARSAKGAACAMAGGVAAEGVSPGVAFRMPLRPRHPSPAVRAKAWAAWQRTRGVRHVESDRFEAAGQPGVLERLREAVGWDYN